MKGMHVTADGKRWDTYVSAELRIRTPHGLIRVIPAPLTRNVGTFPDEAGGPIYVITAHNPGGQASGDAANAVAQADLEAELDQRGLTWWPAAGGDPSWTHVEPSAAVLGIDPWEAVNLGAAYGQEAIFALTPTRRYVLDCNTGRIAKTGWYIQGIGESDTSLLAKAVTESRTKPDLGQGESISALRRWTDTSTVTAGSPAPIAPEDADPAVAPYCNLAATFPSRGGSAHATAVGDAIVGVVANPLSGRDIRRLVTQATVFPTAEKASMIQRMLAAFGAVGVDRALLSTDLGGISAAVFRALGRRRPGDPPWPEVEFLDGLPIRQTAADTATAVARMVACGARVIVCLGGDGTARVAAPAVGDVPMLAVSTGTNNAFPVVREATIAGLAAGLVATGAVPRADALSRAKVLEVRVGSQVETALVDVAVSTQRHVAARAVWDPATLTQLFCAFAEPDAIGLSSILGQTAPVSRAEPFGVTAVITHDSERAVVAPIAPGLVVPVAIREVGRMTPGVAYPVLAEAGVLAVDGERELTFEPGSQPVVRLHTDGPWCVDVPAVLAASARLGLLTRDQRGGAHG
jgi:predicted polyphosphate/ATP-dependent NAD kinase